MTDIYVAKRVIDYVGLGARGIPEVGIRLHPSMQPVLALLQAMGSDGAQLANLDAAGNLRVTLAGQTTFGVVQLGDLAGNIATVVATTADARAPGNGETVAAVQELFNGVNFDRGREASAANLAAQSGLGAALSTPPGMWSQISQPAAGAQATTTKAAAAATRHICTSIDFSAVAAVAPVATVLAVNLRDGASGLGTVLRSWLVFIAAAIGQSVPPFALSGLNLVGSVNTAMTLEFSALLANLQESVSLSGYDAV